MIFWTLIFLVTLASIATVYIVWRRGYTIQELVHNPPQEVDLPQFVTTLGYLHHELIKHRLPLVRTVADQPHAQVDSTDVEMLKQAVTGASGRPSLVGELESYLGGLRRAAGRVHLNFRRDTMVRRVRRACRRIQVVADGLGDRSFLTKSEHDRLRRADKVLDKWFRPRLQALRNSVVSFELQPEIFDEPVERVLRELGYAEARIERPRIPTGLHVRMLSSDFNLVLRNLVRNGLQRSVLATGEARLAVEVEERIELTGEESVLLKVHDTDPTIMARQQLYGGQIGRGLNLVTTTLRRYDGALNCSASRLEGYAKFMEVRLFQAHADPAEVEVLQVPELSSWAVPAGLVTTALAVGALCTAGWFGALPDPLSDFMTDVPVVDPVQEAQRKARQDAMAVAGEKIKVAFEQGDREALMATPEMRRYRIPGPPDIKVDASRCAQPERFTEARRMDLKCHLVDAKSRLLPPVLIFEMNRDYDASMMEAQHKDLVVQKDSEGVKTTEPGPECATVALLPPGEELPKASRDLLPPSVAKKSSFSRIVYNYQDCLKMPRYPVQSRITIRPRQTNVILPKVRGIQPSTIDLRIQLRRIEEAGRVYTKISNNDRHLPQRAARSNLVKAIARHVQEDMTYAGDSAPGYSEEDLGKAYYFGWVRPGLMDGIHARIEGTRTRQPPSAATCQLYDQISEGFGYLQELDPKVVRADLYRSQYYSYHARLWVLGDVIGSMQDFDRFQRDQSRQTDFVQGARLYMALLIARSPPPTPEDVPEADSHARQKRLTAVLRSLFQDANRPPKRGSEYDKTKLLGFRALVGQGDEGFMVNDVLCAFRRVHGAWLEMMPDSAHNKLFSACTGFVARTPPVEPDETDPDAGLVDQDVGLGNEEAPVVPETVQRAEQYMMAFDELLRMKWSCPTP